MILVDYEGAVTQTVTGGSRARVSISFLLTDLDYLAYSLPSFPFLLHMILAIPTPSPDRPAPDHNEP